MYEYLDRRYAIALYEVAEKQGKVEEYLRDLREIVDAIHNNQDILKILKHPYISTKQKKMIFSQTFSGKIPEELLAFLLILIEKDRILYLREKLEQMEKIHLERNNTLIAYITTVVPLTLGERSALTDKLESKYRKKIILKEEIDNSIIGGIFVKVGSDTIDGTLKSRLHGIKETALRTSWR